MRATVAILSTALIALGGGAIHLWRQLDASRHQAADLQARVDATAAYARQAATIAPSPSSPSPSSPLAEPSAATPVAALAALGKTTEESLAVARASFATRPEVVAGIKAIKRANMPILYPDVGKVLGLSPDKVERLYDLLTEQVNEDELASLLGSKYAAWQEYKTEVPTRRQVKDLAAVLSAAGMPLSDAQRDSLIPAVFAAERSNSQELAVQSGHVSISGPSRYSPQAVQRILDTAATYLTRQQLESYRHMLERAAGRETEQGILLDARK
jgi:hypothetical protein